MATFDRSKFYVEPEELWRACDGVYECPKEPDGTRLGPLVGYAGMYQDRLGEMRNFVGEIYYDFAKVEEYAEALDRFAVILALQLSEYRPTVLLGAPMGGIMLTGALGRHLEVRQLFAEKHVIALAERFTRERSELILGRHRVRTGDRVVIVEDVCNNFSTTAQLIALVEEAGATVVAIGCALNRSPVSCYHPIPGGGHFPVHSVIHKEIPEFKQDDSYVADDVEAGRVIWKPKLDWDALMRVVQL